VSTFDSDRVRIELCDVMTIGREDGSAVLTPCQGADIWLGDGEGKIRRSRKPTISLVDETRPALLRQIADWIENRGDPSLSLLASETAAAKAGGDQ
jgi:hypothetical protein